MLGLDAYSSASDSSVLPVYETGLTTTEPLTARDPGGTPASVNLQALIAGVHRLALSDSLVLVLPLLHRCLGPKCLAVGNFFIFIYMLSCSDVAVML